MREKLKELDENIKWWERLVAKYPQSDSYRESLGRLKTERQLLASTIGRKK